MADSTPSEGHPLPSEFIELYSRNQARLFRYVAALVPNLQDAEDVLSETAVTLWQEFHKFEPETNFLAWARRIAHFRVLDHYRHRSRRLPEDILRSLVAEMDRREAEADPRLSFLSECRQGLSPSDQDILEQRYMDKLQVQELAGRLGRPVNSVSKSLGRIRRALLECIRRKMAARGIEGKQT